MIVEKCDMPDIVVDGSALSRFMIGALIGAFSQENGKLFPIIARLVDKARHEYLLARENAQQEEAETKLTFRQIEKRNQGQFLYMAPIVNHLENCINSLARTYKVLKQVDTSYSSELMGLNTIRNKIEHMDEKVAAGKTGSTSLNISSDAKSVEILNDSLSLIDLAKEIEELHKKILKLFNDSSKVSNNSHTS